MMNNKQKWEALKLRAAEQLAIAAEDETHKPWTRLKAAERLAYLVGETERKALTKKLREEVREIVREELEVRNE